MCVWGGITVSNIFLFSSLFCGNLALNHVNFHFPAVFFSKLMNKMILMHILIFIICQISAFRLLRLNIKLLWKNSPKKSFIQCTPEHEAAD